MNTNVPTLLYNNADEIKKITNLICDVLHPEMIVLFGQYAGMPPTNILGGYEFLILCRETSPVLLRELRHYINLHLTMEEGQEKSLSLNLFSVDLVIHKSYLSYFLLTIRQQGILLYTNNRYNLLEKIRFRPQRIYEHTLKQTARCLSMGKAFLENARYNREQKTWPLTAFHLYQAAVQLMQAIMFAHFGFIPNASEDLLTFYSHIRYCSEELNGLWDGDNNLSGWRFFSRLQQFHKQALSSGEFYTSPVLLSDCLERAHLLLLAAENFCQEKLSFLKSL